MRETTPDTLTMPPSGEDMLAAMRREGFYEFAAKVLERRMARLLQELHELRDERDRNAVRVELAEREAEDWKALAMQHGTVADIRHEKGIHVLTGSVAVGSELVRYAHADAINYACANLAKKMRAALPTVSP